MGQYVARIYDETRGRPLYIIATKKNLGAVKPEALSSRETREMPEPEA